ncbi:hypothetical protein ACFL1H_06085, partial [Nanoarchaeota archaeon]
IKNLFKWLGLVGINNSIKFTRFLIWKKHGFCPTNITFSQRLKILNDFLDPEACYNGPIA